MHQVEIAITGSGSFATEVLHALARQTTDSLDVALVARDPDRISRLSRSATELAANAGGRLRIVPVVMDWADDDLIRRTVRELRPKVIVHTASLQSPWTLGGSDGWTTLLKNIGFGFTLPLQAALAVKVARAIAHESPATALVNACYPDAVNPVVSANGLPITGGLGNVAILAAILWNVLDPSTKQGKQLRMIGHHAHFAAFIDGREVEPLKAWLGEVPIHDVAEQRLRNAGLQRNLNDVAGLAAVPMLSALSGRGPKWSGHSPGPLGLPGGYPVIVREGAIEVDLPDEITLEEAKTLNLKAGLADGIAMKDNGEIELPAADQSFTWHASEVEQKAQSLLELRESLGGR